jgi:hypothetical protein
MNFRGITGHACYNDVITAKNNRRGFRRRVGVVAAASSRGALFPTGKGWRPWQRIARPLSLKTTPAMRN